MIKNDKSIEEVRAAVLLDFTDVELRILAHLAPALKEIGLHGMTRGVSGPHRGGIQQIPRIRPSEAPMWNDCSGLNQLRQDVADSIDMPHKVFGETKTHQGGQVTLQNLKRSVLPPNVGDPDAAPKYEPVLSMTAGDCEKWHSQAWQAGQDAHGSAEEIVKGITDAVEKLKSVPPEERVELLRGTMSFVLDGISSELVRMAIRSVLGSIPDLEKFERASAFHDEIIVEVKQDNERRNNGFDAMRNWPHWSAGLPNSKPLLIEDFNAKPLTKKQRAESYIRKRTTDELETEVSQLRTFVVDVLLPAKFQEKPNTWLRAKLLAIKKSGEYAHLPIVAGAINTALKNALVVNYMDGVFKEIIAAVENGKELPRE
jgi:hypothetical protein